MRLASMDTIAQVGWQGAHEVSNVWIRGLMFILAGLDRFSDRWTFLHRQGTLTTPTCSALRIRAEGPAAIDQVRTSSTTVARGPLFMFDRFTNSPLKWLSEGLYGCFVSETLGGQST